MLRGDYQTAARILQPLADDTTRQDPVAQFFLAILNDTGHAGGNNARACGLFHRAAARTNPFSERSSQLAASLRDDLGDAASLFCVADERWQGGPPRSFVLEPGHQILFADSGIRVTYGDSEQILLFRPSPGAVLLPIHYTPLSVTRPAATRLHLFQWFEWTPDTTVNPSSWTLGWMLSEVIGDRWIPIVSDGSLVTVKGPTPPASYGTARLALVRLNALGEAELAIAVGASPRIEAIPWKR
jgi:hypothetical protein